jgi:hypothetical protein
LLKAETTVCFALISCTRRGARVFERPNKRIDQACFPEAGIASLVVDYPNCRRIKIRDHRLRRHERPTDANAEQVPSGKSPGPAALWNFLALLRFVK